MNTTYLPHGWPEGLPDPDIHDLDATGWWQQCAEQRLCMQGCARCGTLRFPPRPICHACRETSSTWREVGPDGEIYSACEAHYAAHPSLRNRGPYVTVLVAPDGSDGERIFGNLLDPVDDVMALIGRRVTCRWEPVQDRYLLPQWSLV